MLENIYQKLRFKWLLRTSKGYEQWLREQGVIIGKNLRLFNHKSISFDTTSPSLIEIGDNVAITADVTILTHDYATAVFVEKYHDYLPGRSKVILGNNIYVGQRTMILRGVTIGDNCIIGACSLVTKDIPANSVAAGIPARVICTIDEYYAKRKAKATNEALAYAKHIIETKGEARVEDFREEFAQFWSPDIECSEEFKAMVANMQLQGHEKDFFAEHVPAFASFEEFIEAAKKYGK